MAISLQLGHVNLRATSLPKTIAWYQETLGLTVMASATNSDPSQNLWLCDAAGRPCIHVNQLAAGETRQAQGHIDHFAFDVADRPALQAHLDALGLVYTAVHHQAARLVQFNLRDPDGVKVELTFHDQDPPPASQ